MESENRVLEMLILTMNPSRLFMKTIKNHLICIGKHNVVEASISLFISLSFPIGKPKEMESENRVLEMLLMLVGTPPANAHP